MAKIQELYDRTTGEAIYPRTSTQAVYDAEGRDLETRLAREVAKTDEKLRQYTKTDALNTALAGKQAALTVSDDLELTPEGMLSVAEGAKRAVFIDLFNEAAGDDGYARMENGVFDCKLNGVPLTYEDAIGVYASYPLCKHRNPTRQAMFAATRNKTLFPINTDSFLATNYIEAFTGCSNLVAVKFITASNNQIVAISSAQNMFRNCERLKYIYGVLAFTSNVNVSGAFDFCSSLEEVRIKNLAKSLNLASSPKLSFDSLAFIVQYAANTTAITVTVHADVFAKLTGDITNEAAAALTEEELTQWGAVLDAALAKNITFATI
jgi:hypothetical protein|nr:MAG TPA: leucine-rich repeat protein [Caudoviricetes sp.]